LLISRIYIDHDVAHFPVVDAMQSRIEAPVEYVKDTGTVYDSVTSATDPVQRGKLINSGHRKPARHCEPLRRGRRGGCLRP